MNSILLSFDLEEFDIPEEFGQKLQDEEKLEVTRRGLARLLELLNTLDVTSTFYVTAFFAEANHELVRKIVERHEIASHGFFHSSFKPEDYAHSKASLEKITGKAVKGFRMARLQPVDDSLLLKAGYSYNSSLNPTWLPGRYNNFGKPTLPFVSNGIIDLPVSVTPMLRIPLFWISFKNMPYAIYRRLAVNTLKRKNYLNLYFHPWEFTNLDSYKLPSYVKKDSGEKMALKLKRLITDLKNHGNFVTSSDYCEKFSEKNK